MKRAESCYVATFGDAEKKPYVCASTIPIDFPFTPASLSGVLESRILKENDVFFFAYRMQFGSGAVAPSAARDLASDTAMVEVSENKEEIDRKHYRVQR